MLHMNQEPIDVYSREGEPVGCEFTALSPSSQQQVWPFKEEKKTDVASWGAIRRCFALLENRWSLSKQFASFPWVVKSSTSIIVKWAKSTPLRHCLSACWAHIALRESTIAVAKRTTRNGEAGSSHLDRG